MKTSKFGCIFIIYGWNLTRSGCNLIKCGWNLTICGCNLIFEHLFYYLLKNWHYQVIEYCSRVGSDGPSGHLAPFLLLLFLFLQKNRKPSIFKRRKSWKRLWILIYVSIYLLILQSLKQINKFTIGTSHSVGAEEGSKPRLSRSTLFNIIYSSNSKEILNVTQYAYLIVWVPRKGV